MSAGRNCHRTDVILRGLSKHPQGKLFLVSIAVATCHRHMLSEHLDCAGAGFVSGDAKAREAFKAEQLKAVLASGQRPADWQKMVLSGAIRGENLPKL